MHPTTKLTSVALACAISMFTVVPSATAAPCLKLNQLGGAFVGAWVGLALDGTETRIELTMIQAPLDLLGRTAALKMEWVTIGKDFEMFREKLGIHPTEAVGQMTMIDRDSAKYTVIWYGITDPPAVIRAIYVLSGQMDFDGPNKLVDHSTIRIYLTNDAAVGPPYTPPEADANHDLLPDDGAVPLLVKVFDGAFSKRVPLLAP